MTNSYNKQYVHAYSNFTCSIPVFKKVKTEHTIMDEFHARLRAIEKHSAIQRIIPGRISRQQS
jgi:uncharacterized protein YutD